MPFNLEFGPHIHQPIAPARLSDRLKPASAWTRLPFRIALNLALVLLAPFVGAETFRVATYNVENYLDTAVGTRPAKSPEARAKIREGLLALKPDVLALQEMGSTNALNELRLSLKAEGLDLPFWDLVGGYDTNIHVAILSRFPFKNLRTHTNENFLLNGRRFRVSRGFAEADFEVNASYSFTLIAVHLKSRRPIPQADEAEMRLQEARLLRALIDRRLAENPNLNLVVLGDLNDTRDTPSTREVIGRGKFKLLDTRPAERNGDREDASNPADETRSITWTHFYAKDDTYSRIDYLLLSSGMAREWISKETYLPTIPNWGLASDHRPLVATFEARDK